MFIHTLLTWLLANVIHPIMMFVCLLIVSNFNTAPEPEMIAVAVPLILVSSILSIPALFISWLMLQVITQLMLTSEMKFLLWLLTAPAMILLQFLVMSVLMDLIAMSEIELIIPAMLSALIAIPCRYNAFVKLVTPPAMEEQTVDLN